MCGALLQQSLSLLDSSHSLSTADCFSAAGTLTDLSTKAVAL